MKAERSQSILSVIVLSVAACSDGGSGDDGAAEDPRAREVLDRMFSTYQSLDSLGVEGIAYGDIKMANMALKMETEFSIRLARPRRYQITWAQKLPMPGMTDGTLWNEGSGAQLYQKMMNSSAPAKDEMTGFSAAMGISGGAANTLPFLFYNLSSLFGELENLQLGKNETVEGEECSVITGRSRVSVGHTLWISKERNVLRRHEYSLERPAEFYTDGFDADLEGAAMEEAIAMMKQAKGVMGERYTSIAINEEYPAEEFAFQPPAGAQRRNSVMEGLQGAGVDISGKFQIGDAAPAFVGQGVDGKLVKLSDYSGKVVLIDFWATWCGPCVAELPNVIRAYERYHSRGLEIIGISLDSSKAPLETFLAKRAGMSWPQVVDISGRIAQLYGVKAIPFTLLLDGSGKIRYQDLRGEALGKAVEELLEPAAK